MPRDHMSTENAAMLQRPFPAAVTACAQCIASSAEVSQCCAQPPHVLQTRTATALPQQQSDSSEEARPCHCAPIPIALMLISPSHDLTQCSCTHQRVLRHMTADTLPGTNAQLLANTCGEHMRRRA